MKKPVNIKYYKYVNEECLGIKMAFGREIMQDLISADKTVAEGAENIVKSILIADIKFQDFIALAIENAESKVRGLNHE